MNEIKITKTGAQRATAHARRALERDFAQWLSFPPVVAEVLVRVEAPKVDSPQRAMELLAELAPDGFDSAKVIERLVPTLLGPEALPHPVPSGRSEQTLPLAPLSNVPPLQSVDVTVNTATTTEIDPAKLQSVVDQSVAENPLALMQASSGAPDVPESFANRGPDESTATLSTLEHIGDEPHAVAEEVSAAFFALQTPPSSPDPELEVTGESIELVIDADESIQSPAVTDLGSPGLPPSLDGDENTLDDDDDDDDGGSTEMLELDDDEIEMEEIDDLDIVMADDSVQMPAASGSPSEVDELLGQLGNGFSETDEMQPLVSQPTGEVEAQDAETPTYGSPSQVHQGEPSSAAAQPAEGTLLGKMRQSTDVGGPPFWTPSGGLDAVEGPLQRGSPEGESEPTMSLAATPALVGDETAEGTSEEVGTDSTPPGDEGEDDQDKGKKKKGFFRKLFRGD